MRRTWTAAGLAWAGSIAAVMFLPGCDTGGRKDLPQDQQVLDESVATVMVFPDKFPNIAHKCMETTGFWTTTDRDVWIVYNDPSCGGTGPIMIFSNVAGSRPQGGDGSESG